MPFALAHHDRIFRRRWRPRHPLQRRLSRWRTWGMRIILFALCIIIFGYAWLTNPQRLRAMAGGALSQAMGARVSISGASLSIFEGLRLSDVTLSVDETPRADSEIFHARALVVRFNPAKLFEGKLIPTQVIAIEPVVRVAEDPVAHTWNYQRLGIVASLMRGGGKSTDQTPAVLPQIILRDAVLAHLEIHGNEATRVGWYSLEGNLRPTDEPDSYNIQLQSRGPLELGPSLDGILRTRGRSQVRLRNFSFGPDIAAMLQPGPRAWCEAHELHGRIDEARLSYLPERGNSKPPFRAEIDLAGVEMAVTPHEWMNPAQIADVELFHGVLDHMAARGGQWQTWAQNLRNLSTAQPIHVRQLQGHFIFTEQGIEVNQVSGSVEGNAVNVSGHSDGYGPHASGQLTLATPPGQNATIPGWSPALVASLPGDIADLCERVRPTGTYGLRMSLDRPQPDGKINIAGQIDVINGKFCFADFPFPISDATGKFVIGPDDERKLEGVRIVNLRGHGPPGVNAQAVVTINGFVGPFHDVAGIWLNVTGENLCSDPILRAALPVSADAAMRMFDPDRSGHLPVFRTSFTSRINRAPAIAKTPTIVETDIAMDQVQGRLDSFPYPLADMSGNLEVRDGYLNIINAHMKRGGATVAINGFVRWKDGPPGQPPGPPGAYLSVNAKGIPIDADLKTALPEEQREWLRRSGVSGTLDLQGRVFPVAKSSATDFDFDLALSNGRMQPNGGEFAMTDVLCKMHLLPGRLQITGLTGRRGEGKITAAASVDWRQHNAIFSLAASAQNIALDAPLYKALPAAARSGWDAAGATGTIDARIRFDGPDSYELHVWPRELSAVPAAFAYSLQHVQGSVTVTPDRADIDITAKHGDGSVAFKGTGDLSENQTWDMKISAANLPVDVELSKAVPQAVAATIKALGLHGTIGLEIPKFSYRPAGKDADADLAATIRLKNADASIGIPMHDAAGTVTVAVVVRGGNLHRLAAHVALDTLMLAGRPAADFKLDIDKPGDAPVFQISHVIGAFAGGDIAGDGQLTLPDKGPGHYDTSLRLHEADLQQLEPGEKNIAGKLTASLQMSGTMDNPGSRRGHGDVIVGGQTIYNVPLLFGALQMANLALPIKQPFNRATATYILDGEKVKIERIEVEGTNLTITGDGQLDFGANTVRLRLVTNNPALVNLPLGVGDLIQLANGELMTIRVTGTIRQPQVSTHAFDTITTTVDQVLKTDENKQ